MSNPNSATQPDTICYGLLPIYLCDDGSKEYLLVQNYGGYWGFPKGHPEPDETPKMTALREAKEEVGLSVTEESLAAPIEYEYTLSVAGNIQTKRVVLFPAPVSDKKVTIQADEIKAFEWVNYERAVALVNLPGLAEPMRSIESQ